MPYALGGTGYIGVATEATYGTYLAPTKFIPIRSESLQKVEDKIYRTNIRGIADRSGAIQGYYHVEGDVEFEVTSDAIVYFFYAGRFTPTKTPASPAPYTYTFIPSHVASPSTAAGAGNPKSLSIFVQRNAGRRFGYLGMNVTQMAFRVDNGLLICTASMMGLEEAQQAIATPTWSTNQPFGPTYNSLEVPTATPRTDIDTFNLTINDGGDAQNRIKTTGGRAPAFIQWGEREITMSFDIDFDTLTDYNLFLNQTITTITWKSIIAAPSDSLTMLVPASIEDSYQVNLSSLGDLVRASTAWHGIYNTTDAFTGTVLTNESIT